MQKTEEKGRELIFDWNRKTKEPLEDIKYVEFDDETLRDGLQSPSVKDPCIEDKIEILHLMDRLQIDSADIGLPGAGERVKEDVYRLAKEIRDSKLKIEANCAARTLKVDIDPVIDISQRTGIPIEVSVFIGSSPIRQYVEGWDIDFLLKCTEEAVSYVVSHDLPCMYVTEDTTRANPETIGKLYKTAIECGAKRICLCDTVGHATPAGVKALIKYVKDVIREEVKIDWHGHSDRGLSLINALSALEAGAHRLHGTALGIGERVGNTPMDLLLVNLNMLGVIERDLRHLYKYCKLVSTACEVPIPVNYPVFGEDAFRTGTGVHAAAVIKALRKGDTWLQNRVYSGVPAEVFGLEQRIEIGPMSGEWNCIYWLEKNGIEPKKELVRAIFDRAKKANKILKDEEIMEVVRGFKSS